MPPPKSMPAPAIGGAQYLPPLTGIRALAALLVLGLHADQNIPIGLRSLLPFFDRGYFGVDFFFILSGFIITHVYFASLAYPSASAVRIFLWHRFIRLYPVHVTVLVGLVAIVSFADAAGIAPSHPQQWQWSQLFWQLTLLHAWGVTEDPGWNVPSWSISAEWFAYLLFPLLAPALMRVRERVTALLIAVATLVVMALVFAAFDWSLNSFATHWVGPPTLARVFGEFLCGAALCRGVALGGPLPGHSADLLGAGAFVAFLLGASVGVPDFPLVALLALTVLAAATAGGKLADLLGSRPMVWLGEISYSVYMVHFPVLIVIRRFWERLGFAEWAITAKTLAFLATIALVIALAAALSYVVERPARIRLRDQMGRLALA